MDSHYVLPSKFAPVSVRRFIEMLDATASRLDYLSVHRVEISSGRQALLSGDLLLPLSAGPARCPSASDHLAH